MSANIESRMEMVLICVCKDFKGYYQLQIDGALTNCGCNSEQLVRLNNTMDIF